MIDEKTIVTLEFDKILETVAGYSFSEKGKERILALRPFSSPAICKSELDKTSEAHYLMYNLGVFPSFSLCDVTESLNRAEKGSMLSMGELLKIADLLHLSDKVKSSILKAEGNFNYLKTYAYDIFPALSLERDIKDWIISDSEMSDNASPELATIRRNIKRANEKLREKLNSFTTSNEYSKALQDNIVTMRNGRYVLPVKSDSRGAVKGLIHDQSASGQTVYIEPLAIVEMNNELRTLALEEQREIEKILRQLTTRVGIDSKAFLRNFEILTEMDVIFARATYSHEINGVYPELDVDGIIDIKKGRHPLIDKKKVVPITLNLGKKFDILLITGPNTGGKTVTLKMTGLLSLMGMTGFFIPANEGSRVGFYENIFCDIGDEQSIEQNLSTFSSHVSNTVDILNRTNKASLLLFDELGAGTDPEEGAALAVAITDYIKHTGAKAVITTHYSPLKEYSYSTDRVENAGMDFNPQTFAPTYNLIIGIPGTSNALEIAKSLGMKKEIIEAAKKGITREKASFEEVLQSADFARRKAEEEAERCKINADLLQAEKEKLEKEKEALAQTRERLNLSARKEVKRMTQNALEEVNAILEELKNILDNPQEGSYFQAAKLRKKIENLNVEEEREKEAPDTVDDPPQVGDTVFVFTLNTTAVLWEINKNGEYLIKLGGIKTHVRRKDVKKLKNQPAPKKTQQKQAKSIRGLQNAPIVTEIMLLGQTCDEAIYNLEKFLDNCKISGIKEIRIIHGKGTGKLRAAVWEFLNKQQVPSYRLGKYGEGGDGVTIATLK